jgi:hypothetical protein
MKIEPSSENSSTAEELVNTPGLGVMLLVQALFAQQYEQRQA